MAQNIRDLTRKDCLVVMKYLKGDWAKNNLHVYVTLGDNRPSRSTGKNLVDSFKTGQMSTEHEGLSGRQVLEHRYEVCRSK
jgi:hypothetical protein